MAVDRIDWHWDAIKDAVSEQEHWERAGTHIGYYIEWAFRKGFANPEIHGSEEEVKKILDSGVNGVRYLIDYCDAKLTSDDFNEEGKNFTSFVYGKYVNNLGKIVGHEPYIKNYKQQDFQVVSNYLDKMYEVYLTNKPPITNAQKNEQNNTDILKVLAIIIISIIVVAFIAALGYGVKLALGDQKNNDIEKVPAVNSPKVNIVKF